MREGLISLTTDFGGSSPYVAQMKAVAVAINPEVRLIDVTHTIPPQAVEQAAVVLADVASRFPPGAIHVCVVDPGVGTQRKIIYAECGNQRFVAPDNGVLSLVGQELGWGQVISLDQPAYWREPVSHTFHGRDIMVPVAAHLTLGVAPAQLGHPTEPMQLAWPVVEQTEQGLVGQVLLADDFGNLITNIRRDLLPSDIQLESVTVRCAAHRGLPLVKTYGEVPAGTAVALFGSSDRLEIAVTNRNAAQTLGSGPGAPVEVYWPHRKGVRHIFAGG